MSAIYYVDPSLPPALRDYERERLECHSAPGSPDTAYPSYAAVWALNPAPDSIIRLKRGTTFAEELWFKSGAGPDAPFTVETYGEGAAPVMTHPTEGNMLRWNREAGLENTTVRDLRFYRPTMDPENPAFNGRAKAFLGDPFYDQSPVSNLLFDGCMFDHCTASMYCSSGSLRAGSTGAIFRNTLFYRGWQARDLGHAQGVYAAKFPLTFEDCVVLEGGWCPTAPPGALAEATMFNHAMYLTYCPALTITGCTFDRPSAMGVKLRSDTSGGAGTHIFNDNLFIDNEVSISAGGNTDLPDRFARVEIENNVGLFPGFTCPTAWAEGDVAGRNLAWFLDCNDWSSGVIRKNLLLGQGRPDRVQSTSYAKLWGVLRGVTMDDNYFHCATMHEALWIKGVQEGCNHHVPRQTPKQTSLAAFSLDLWRRGWVEAGRQAGRVAKHARDFNGAARQTLGI
jgi:hypothetical protein